ncbi:MAG: head decoration protein [Hyphomicrobium sp. 12-62-95]|nr:MAG: head decoration protein [Hyphomicrobium sp. 12-62-95]
MANALRVKRRVSGAAGAPASLMTGELAWNQVDETLYGGKGDDGSGTATSIVALAGPGAFVDISTTQTIGGAKTFSVVPKSAQDASASTDLVRKSQVDSALAGKANTSHTHAVSDVTGLQTALDGKAAASHTHTASQISDSTLAGRALLTGADAAAQRTALGLGSAATQASSAFAAATHGHTVADVTGLQTALDGKAALASPTFTGTPAAPTAASGTNTTQIATTAFVQAAIGSFGAGDMAKATYDTDNDGKVDAAEVADAVAWTGITGKPATFAPSTHAHAISEVTGLQGALDAKAPLASPALTGTPTAPTATAGTNTTQVATTAFVAAAIAALIDAAPGALDTLNELAAALGITGGSIDGVTLDGGTF